MKNKKLFWKLFKSYIIIICVFLLVTIIFTTTTWRDFYHERVASSLRSQVLLIKDEFKKPLGSTDKDKIKNLTYKYSAKISSRITFIGTDGKVISDSHYDAELLENHSGRPEIKKALSGEIGKSIRYSKTLQQKMMYIAIPVKYNNEIIGILRNAVSINFIDRNLSEIFNRIIVTTLITSALLGIISWIFSRNISTPLESLAEGALKFAEGDLNYKLSVPQIKEIAEVAIAMNKMAKRLDNRINKITRQKQEKEVIFSNLSEGIIAIDNEKNIRRLNKSAANLLEIKDIEDAQKKNLYEAIEEEQIINFIEETLNTENESLEKEICVIKNGNPLLLQLKGITVKDSKNTKIEALFVLKDITRIKQLEKIRKDFVSNVSHELKTPITSIKGFIETLNDGALSDIDTAKRFLEIISKHANRLSAIVEDLLSLSRLEQSNESITLETYNLKEILVSALQVCEIKSKAKNIEMELICPEQIQADINLLLFEQAIVNLVINAIKYSNENKKINVKVEKYDKYICIDIIDQGFGIPPEHLPRIFERFYRVDKARSRKQGGTGLGLSIVKHIAQIHNGYVEVKSIQGFGSTFSFYLPMKTNVITEKILSEAG